MSLNNDKDNEIQVESKFNNLNISDNDSNSVNINCHNFDNKFWCKKCAPRNIIEGWTSGNYDIDKVIKDTIYNTRRDNDIYYYPLFLEWVPFDKLADVKLIGEGGFAKVYSATWIDGDAVYTKQDDESWRKLGPKSMKVALKRLNESQNISDEDLNELKIHWEFYQEDTDGHLEFYGITKDPATQEFMMIMQLAEGNLRCFLSSNFKNILWENKIWMLRKLAADLKGLHKLGYSHRDFHCGNILHDGGRPYISDFGLSSKSNEQNDKVVVYGVLPYIAPEVLNGEQHTLSSDIYSFGVIMTELSSGKPPFHKREHGSSLALDICNGHRPECENGTPEVYKKLAYRCMNAYSDQRPTANKLYDILNFWRDSICDYDNEDNEKFEYKGKEIKAMFEEADKEISNISTSYMKVPNAIYTNRAFTFSSNLSKPINSSIISTLYLNDSRIIHLEVPSSLQVTITSYN